MGVLEAILAVFTAIGNWIPTAIQQMVPVFYGVPEGGTEAELTFLGVLAVAGLAFSVVFLIIGLIQRFLHFSG